MVVLLTCLLYRVPPCLERLTRPNRQESGSSDSTGLPRGRNLVEEVPTKGSRWDKAVQTIVACPAHRDGKRDSCICQYHRPVSYS